MSTRKPTWSAVTYAEIEEARLRMGLPKRRMASEILGVTNSTYHNWCRGKATPTLAQQRRIVEAISAGSKSSAPAPEGAAEATASVVRTYLETSKHKLEPGELARLTREVFAVFGGAA